MKVAITGSSGLIGTALVASLQRDGHAVRRLVRHTPQSADEVQWQPGVADPAAVQGCDAVVHLAGVGVGDRRWSAARKAVILRSRVDGTTSIAESIARADPRPATLVSASAIGYYGDTGDREADESSPPGDGFLADVVRQWEAATAPAENVGVRVVHLRSGIVLAASGGVVGRVLPLFRLGVGGRLGSGRQWMSWITLPDEVAAIRYALDSDLRGPVNLSTPEPVRNAEFTRAFGAAVHRPAVLPVPAVALRAALGGFADEGVLVSQRVLPTVLREAGFRWQHPTIGPAMQAALQA